MVMEGLVRSAPARELAVGLRTYLEIVSVDAPSEAAYGDSVLINIYVRNKWTDRIFAIVTGGYDEAEFYSDSHYILPDSQRIFGFSFTMPNKSVDLWIWAWYWTETGWSTSPDDEYGPISISLAPPVVGWQPLGTPVTIPLASAAPPVVGWQPLGTPVTIPLASAAPPVVGWQPLGTPVTLGVASVAPPVVGWQPLGTPVTINVAAGPFPPWWELIHEQIYHWGYIYRGDAEVCSFTFKFPPEQIPGVDWMSKKLVEILASTLEDHDSKLLELKLWRDTRPVMWTDYKCEVIASASPVSKSIAIAALPWYAIVAIVCGLIIAVAWSIRATWKTIFEPHGLPEPVKAEWTRDTLIRAICETPPKQTPESVAEMSDGELRHLLNEKLAKREGWPWYMWLGIAGLGIAGSFVAVTALRTFAPKK